MTPTNRSFKKLFLDTGLMTNVKAWCFGKDPVVSPIQVAFAAGAKMFSTCSVISFTAPKSKDTEHNSFKIVFCAKLHSKIHRRDPMNRSCWYIWQQIGNSGCIVLDPQKFEDLTGIDADLVTLTNEFKALQKTFKAAILNGLKQAEELKFSEVKPEDRNEYDTYLQSLKEASELITQIPDFMDKSFKLINYDKFRDELQKKGYGNELKMRGAAMTQSNTKIGKRFMDKVNRNALRDGEKARAEQELLKKFAAARNS